MGYKRTHFKGVYCLVPIFNLPPQASLSMAYRSHILVNHSHTLETIYFPEYYCHFLQTSTN